MPDPDRLNHNDETAFRRMLADTEGTGGFAASLASLRGLIGEIDHLRREVARLSGLEPVEIVAPYGERPDGTPRDPWD